MSQASTAKPEKTPAPTNFDIKTRPIHGTDAAKIERGHVVAILQYAAVEGFTPRHPMHREPVASLRDLDTGLLWDRTGKDLLERIYSADQVVETIALPKTKLVELMQSAGHRPFTVCWIKKEGEERTLRGVYLDADEHSLGYSRVVDLDKPANDRLRKVDHRTIKWLILDGVRYEART